MNPYEWPWENHPVEADEPLRVTARLRKKVRKLSRKVSRMERELRKMRKYMQRLAAGSAAASRPPVSDLTLKLVGEAQRAAASYSTTRSDRAAQEVTRTREALLRHVAELESRRSAPAPPTRQAPPPPRPAAPPAQVAPYPTAETPPPGPAGPAEEAAPAPDSLYRWMRDAVSLLRAAGFSSEGHGILRDQLTEQALSFMAQRAAQADAQGRAAPSRGASEPDRAPIGRPRLGGAPLAPPAPPSMSSRPPVRHPGPPPSPEPVQPPPPPREVLEESVEQPPPFRDPVRTEAALSDHPPYDSSAETPLTDPGEGSWPAAHPNGHMEGGEYRQEHEPPGEDDESGPRRWWSYAPIPPRDEE